MLGFRDTRALDLWVKGLGFRVLDFWVWGLGYRGGCLFARESMILHSNSPAKLPRETGWTRYKRRLVSPQDQLVNLNCRNTQPAIQHVSDDLFLDSVAYAEGLLRLIEMYGLELST